VPTTHRWPLRRKSISLAALLSISGGAEAVALEPRRFISWLARVAGSGSIDSRHSSGRRQLGIADPGRLGIGLGNLAERHGSHAIHLLPASRRIGLQAGDGRDHLRIGTSRDVSARRAERL